MKIVRDSLQLSVLKTVLSFRILLSGNRLWTKVFLRGLRYWRIIELPYVLNWLTKRGRLDVLDISSPKVLAFHIARKYGHRVTATDLWGEEVKLWDQALDAVRRTDDSWSNLVLEVQDAKHLTYPDESFDFVYSVSVIEHIDDQGDTEAMKEINRVLRKGGLAVITVPFDPMGYDVYKNEDVYFKRYTNQPVFYERWYSKNHLNERLVTPSGLEILDISLAFEKHFPLQRESLNRLYHARPTIANLWSLVEPLVGLMNLRVTPDLTKKDGIALLTLRKPQ
jgi:SAM-dependent methyltransferase